MRSLLIPRLHLNHDTRAVVGEVKGVFLIQTHANDVTIPTHTPVIVSSLKSL